MKVQVRLHSSYIIFIVVCVANLLSCSQSYRSTHKLMKDLNIDSISKVEISIFQKYDTTILINEKKIIRNLFKKDSILIDLEIDKLFNDEVNNLVKSIIDTVESNNYSPFYDFTDYKSITDSILIEELKINENLYLSDEISKYQLLMVFFNKKTNEKFCIHIQEKMFEIWFSEPEIIIKKNISNLPITMLKIIALPLTLIPMRSYTNYYSDTYKLPRMKFEEKTNNLVKKIVKYHNLHNINLLDSTVNKIKWYEE